ncbi:MAG: hypothetical protein KDC98_11870, partial [Planctomycetes bacterium]|nr:hypothetical protein [Planctomycetota bacterium]
GITSSGSSFLTGPSGNVRISPTGGIVMFGCYLYGPGITNTGTTATGRNDGVIFWGPVGALQILAQRGSPAPSGGSVYDTAFNSISLQNTGINRQGIALFKADLVGGDVVAGVNDDAWVIGGPGAHQWMCRESDLLLGGAVAVGSLGFQAQMDENGFVLHDETLSQTLGTTPASATDDSILLLYNPGGTQTVIAREGDPVPGVSGGLHGTIAITSRAFSRRNKYLVYATTMTGPGVSTADDSVLVAGTPGNLTLVAREGDPAPTGVAGDAFSGFYTTGYTINDEGTVCFLAILTGPSVTNLNNVALFYRDATGTQMLARGGDTAADMPAGYIIGTASNSGMASGTPHLNDLGQVLFAASVWDGVNNTSGVTNQYAYDPIHGLHASHIGGEAWTAFGGATVTNHGTSQFNSGDGSPAFFNNNGDYCSRTFFTGGSGVNIALLRNHLGSLHGSTASLPATGGTQTLDIDATAANAGKLYVLAGCISGSRPGFTLFGKHIPLNNDFWLTLSIQNANGPVYPNSWGILNGSGQASTAFAFPAGFAGLIGATFHHAVGVLDTSTGSLDLVSEPVSVRLY